MAEIEVLGKKRKSGCRTRETRFSGYTEHTVYFEPRERGTVVGVKKIRCTMTGRDFPSPWMEDNERA